MRRFLFGLALILGIAPPAHAISIIAGTDTGGALGHVVNAGSTTGVVTTTATVAPGNLVVAMLAANAGLTISACTDSASNTYTAASANTFSGTNTIRMFYSYTTNNLASGGTVTCTTNSASSTKTMVVVAFSGTTSTPIDSAGISNGPAAAGVTGTSATYTVGPTGTLNYPGGANGEVIVGYIKPNTTTAPTNDPSFIDLGSFLGSVGQADSAFAYKIVSANTPITYAPTGPSAAYVGNLAAFIGTGGGVAGAGQGQPLLGVTN